ncbi:MAG: family 10 glycosylhydrolase [Blastocatellia bacterium]|nr:family 10 glycosylhydrolase [Blastocatellia bacterium]
MNYLAGLLCLSMTLIVACCVETSMMASLRQAPTGQFRAFWVDAFNPGFKTPEQIDALITHAKQANVNALLLQVRRRGDSYYLNSLEPPAQDASYNPQFDALQYAIERARANGIEVHAFVATLAIWQTTFGVPAHPNHVYNQHGPTKTGRDFWLTHDQTGALAPAGGGRIYLDPGHPDAVDYTVNVLVHLIKHYELDGLHLDIIRYPEGGNWGYNPVNIERFQRRYGRAAVPSPADPDFQQWRRDQVTNLVRKIYLHVIAIKPHLKLSMAAIAFGAAPVTESDWRASAAYAEVYQDWRAWLEEGIIDMAIVMNYDREHNTTQRTWFNDWIEWDKNHRYNRHVVIGIGAFLNSIEGSLAQARRALLMPSRQGAWADGIAFYSYATTNAAAPPSNIIRPNTEFYRALSQPTSYDPVQPPIFADPAPTPPMTWKTHPTQGHVMGTVKSADGQPVDGALIEIASASNSSIKWVQSDGSGFFGAVGLEPDSYRIRVRRNGVATASVTALIAAGQVTIANLRIEH